MIPDYIQSLAPYVPGKPIEETQREFKLKKVVKLASNENPLGCGSLAREAIKRSIKDIHRYPDASAFALKRAIQRVHRIENDPRFGVLVGNGSNELIELFIRTLCVPGDAIATTQGAFIAYKISAQAQGVRTVESPLPLDTLVMDLGALLEKVRAEPRVRAVFLPNPNNPTGTYVPAVPVRNFISQVIRLHGGDIQVILDDAYAEYVTAKDAPRAEDLVREFPDHVSMMRTFSKVHGLGGLRIGYAIGPEKLFSFVNRIRMPFNVSSTALGAAEAALKDVSHVKASLKVNREGMKFWEKALKQLGIPFFPSQGNFILADVWKGMGKTGGEVFQECLRQGVIFRPVTNYGMPHFLRISIGTESENRFALKALQRLVKK